MKELIVLPKEWLEDKINSLRIANGASLAEDRSISQYAYDLLNELLLKSKSAEEVFNAAREFNSQDGIVDIHIVISYPNADNSDLTPLYPVYQDYLNSLK